MSYKHGAEANNNSQEGVIPIGQGEDRQQAHSHRNKPEGRLAPRVGAAHGRRGIPATASAEGRKEAARGVAHAAPRVSPRSGRYSAALGARSTSLCMLSRSGLTPLATIAAVSSALLAACA